MLIMSKNNIVKAYKRNLNDTKYFSSGYNRIYDNFHILIKSFDECKCSHFFKEKKIPTLFIHVYNFLLEKNFEATEESFFIFLESLGKKYYLTYKELFSISSIINASCLYEIGILCEEKRIAENNNSDIKILSSSISLLREKENWDYEKIISEISKTEDAFIEYEPSFLFMDSSTKNKYRETFSDFCQAQKISEKDAAELLKTYCHENNVTIGDIIFKPDKLPRILFVALSSIFTVFAVFISTFSLGAFGTLLAIPSILITSMNFADVIMSSKEKTEPCPRLELETIPKEGKTAVVISSLLISEKENYSLCENAERFYLLNRDENICFTILLDFPESESEKISEKEKSLMENLFNKIDFLNKKYENKFVVLIRNRIYNENEKRYYGEERKRGAISALVNLITDNTSFDYSCGDISLLKNVKYLFLLDSDTEIGFSAVKKAVSCALHPLNKPILEDGRVVKGYGVFQPSVKFSLVHKKQTEFEAFISGSGGVDNYESASYDRFQSILGSGIFCGKGLIDVELYKKTVIPSIPKNSVLSHDMPEGNLLRCRLVSDLTVTDGVPSNPISYFSRLHRWIRGDFQNLIFLKNKNMSEYSDFKILNNIIRHITPFFSLLLLIIYSVSEKSYYAAFFSLMYLLFPFLSVIIFAPFRAFSKSTTIGRRFYSQVSGVYASNLFRTIYEIALIPHYAFVAIDSFFKSFYRMFFSKKLLLQWKTFGQSESSSKKGILNYYKEFFFNVLMGVILLFSNDFLLKLIGIVWIFIPLFLNIMSMPQKKEDIITPEEKEQLSYFSKKIWNFFADNVDSRTNYLPPDNIQSAPTDAVAYRTSPTNIGFYLLSCLAAVDFGFIEISEAKRRLENSISVIEKLEKWNGHLYNWYDLKKLDILGNKFISTVDSGNFVTMLVSLKEGLKERGVDDIASRIERIIDETDFSYLYNKKKNLFSIGYNFDSNKLEDNCYDLYMSEARTTSYFACAKNQVKEKHWKCLGRTLITEGGYLGMASWSGTMFEYFMPSLLLPVYKNSFPYEALVFAFNQQRKFSVSKLWGTSESGFYAFDSELNYQYKAHGVPSLSLKRYPENEKVLSPYSAFLTLRINRRASISNLIRFKEAGLWGQYGFYESVDFKNGKAIVKSYMSHHMGMSLISAANACFDNIFVNRFMADKEMGSAKELLKERIPTSASVYRNPTSETNTSRLYSKLFDSFSSTPSASSPQLAILSSGNLSMRISDCGHVQFLFRGIPLNETDFSYGEINHSFACGFIDTHNNISYVAPLLSDSFKSCSFEFGKEYASHIISHKDFAASISYTLSESGDCFIIESKGNIKRKYSPFIVFEPQMIENKQYFSAKSFSMMKTRCEFEEESESFFITNKDSLFSVCIQCDKKIHMHMTNRDNLETGNFFNVFNVMNILDILNEKNKKGSSVYPLCFIKASQVSGGCCRFYISVGKTKEQSRAICSAEKKRQFELRKNMSELDPYILSNMSSSILFQKVNKTESEFVSLREELWKRGISGDYPIFCIYAKEIFKHELSQYIKVFTSLYRTHVKAELFVFFDEEDIYFRETENILSNILNLCGGTFLKGKTPGIHLLNTKNNEQLFKSKHLYCGFITLSNKIPLEKELSKTEIFPLLDSPSYSLLEENENNFISIEKNEFTFYKRNLPKRKPFSYILSGENFGSVVTDSSLGFTFSENSRLCKISNYDESPHSLNGEKLISYYNGNIYDLCAISNIFKCKNGVAIYEGEFSDVKYSVCTFVSVSKKEKYVIGSFSKEGISTALTFVPLLRENFADKNPIAFKTEKSKKERFVFFYNSLNLFKKSIKAYCTASGTENTMEFPIHSKNKITVFATGQRILFRLGTEENEAFQKDFSIENVLAEKSLSEEFAKSFVPKMEIKTDIKELDNIFPFLFYQTASSRFYSKTGYYQNGGAFGFRDQLQDCLSLIYSSKNIVRAHLLKAASHQYKEGDVMHWWHEIGEEHFGVRTTCSDDFLWLPIVVSKYVKLTGDLSILNERCPFLISQPLENNRKDNLKTNERYEKAVFSEDIATLYEHCILALNRGFSNCKNGISLMGCCDWNDGFSNMGNKGEGLSLFSTRLLVMACMGFIPLIKSINETDIISETIPMFLQDENLLFKKAKEIEQIIENEYFINGQYVRCVSDDGKYFGIGETKACKTDILCQAFAVLCGTNEKRGKEALLYAYSKLYHEESKTLMLFSPPFNDETEIGGYINSYPEFIRENGGQYTHAAVWTAIALIKCGETEKGISLLKDISPLSRCKTVEDASIYKNEPYVLSADISINSRGGWSWYTGAASWFSVAFLEYVLGLKFKGSMTVNGVEKYVGAFKCLVIKPIIPYKAKISLEDYTLNISVKKGKNKILLDGAETMFPIVIPPKNCELEVFFE